MTWRYLREDLFKEVISEQTSVGVRQANGMEQGELCKGKSRGDKELGGLERQGKD